MIMQDFHVKFSGFVRQYLPAHKRTAVRLRLLGALVNLQSLFDNFAEWRKYYRYKIALTSQCIVLQGHLQRLFGAGILVKSYTDGYLSIGLNIEPAHWRSFGVAGEGVNISVPLEGENETMFDDVDFVIIVDDTVDMTLLRAEIERYKLADKKYKITIR